jgi:hypothetical protein
MPEHQTLPAHLRPGARCVVDTGRELLPARMVGGPEHAIGFTVHFDREPTDSCGWNAEDIHPAGYGS